LLLNVAIKTVDPRAWIVEKQFLSGGGKVPTGEHRSTENWWNGTEVLGKSRMILIENTGVLSTGGKMLIEEHRSTEK